MPGVVETPFTRIESLQAAVGICWHGTVQCMEAVRISASIKFKSGLVNIVLRPHLAQPGRAYLLKELEIQDLGGARDDLHYVGARPWVRHTGISPEAFIVETVQVPSSKFVACWYGQIDGHHPRPGATDETTAQDICVRDYALSAPAFKLQFKAATMQSACSRPG